jgi:hypothetical protein
LWCREKKFSYVWQRCVAAMCPRHGIQQLMSVRGSLYDAAAKLTHGLWCSREPNLADLAVSGPIRCTRETEKDMVKNTESGDSCRLHHVLAKMQFGVFVRLGEGTIKRFSRVRSIYNKKLTKPFWKKSVWKLWK